MSAIQCATRNRTATGTSGHVWSASAYSRDSVLSTPVSGRSLYRRLQLPQDIERGAVYTIAFSSPSVLKRPNFSLQ